MESKKNLTAVITGASSDVGLAITKLLIDNGFHVLGHYNSNANELLTLNHPSLFLQKADLTQFPEAENLINVALEKLGHIDVLINMVGPFSRSKDLLSVTPTEWRESIELNLNIAFTMCYYAKDHLIQAKGHILNFCFAGVENIRAWTTASSYAAAKAGLAVLTKSLAVSLAAHGVRVNAICPGYIDFGHFSPAQTEEILKKIPQDRMCHPEEIISAVSWLLLQSPKHMTGSFMTLSGGWEHS